MCLAAELNSLAKYLHHKNHINKNIIKIIQRLIVRHNLHKVTEAKHAHAAEISFGILSLEP